jgi:hypothetical protein
MLGEEFKLAIFKAMTQVADRTAAAVIVDDGNGNVYGVSRVDVYESEDGREAVVVSLTHLEDEYVGSWWENYVDRFDNVQVKRGLLVTPADTASAALKA